MSCDEDKVQEKRKRPDRVEKLAGRKQNKHHVVKAALQKYIHGSAETVLKIQNAIISRVYNMSRKAVNMSIAFSGWLKTSFDGVIDVNTVDLENVFEQTFFRQFMLGTAECDKPDARITLYLLNNPRLQPSATRHFYDRNIFSAEATTYLTNVCNSLRVNIDSRIRTFCKHFGALHRLSNIERIVMLYMINGWTYPRTLSRGALPIRQVVFDVVILHRYILGLLEGDTISKGWMRSKACLPSILRYNVYLNRFYADQNIKLFNIVPIHRIKNHYMTIDTSVLFGIMKDCDLIDAKCNFETFDALRNEHWESTFMISKLQGQNSIFQHNVETDGLTMSMHFEKPLTTCLQDYVQPKKKLYVPSFKEKLVTNDPGRINIYYMIHVLPDGTVKTFILTRKQYYHDSGITTANLQSAKWNLGIKESLEALSTVSSKGCDLHNHLEYLNVFFANCESLWSEYTKRRWSRQRLSLHAGKKKVFSNFYNGMIDYFSEETNKKYFEIVVAYGSAKFAPGGKGELSVPTSRAYYECASRVKTIATSEFRSSKVDASDDSILQLVATRDKPRYGLRGVLWNTKTKKFVSRDLNAALNIRRNLLHRPAILQPENAKAKLLQKIKKRIKQRNT